jgi:Zn-dependent protease with chaperone function
MENERMFYYDGMSTRPSEVRVLVFQDRVHLRKDEDPAFDESFLLEDSHINSIGYTRYLYFDKAGLRYLQYHANHHLASAIASEVEKSKGNWGQKLLKQRMFVLLLIVVALGASLYLITVNLIPFIGMRVIGVEQEIKIGDKLKDITLKEAPVFGNRPDSSASQRLQSFTDQLRLSSKYPIRVTFVNSDMVNAYALPGGNIVVYRGILEKIKTPEELAALLAHESSHINQRHSLRSLLRSAANGILISVIFGDASGISGAVVSNAEALNGLRYSRSLEAEADEKGMDLLLANKVNVDGMKQLMHMLQKEDKLPGSLAFISTHPLTKERVAATEKYLSKHHETFERRADLEEAFKDLKDKMPKW